LKKIRSFEEKNSSIFIFAVRLKIFTPDLGNIVEQTKFKYLKGVTR